eukprot:gene9147-16270_t
MAGGCTLQHAGGCITGLLQGGLLFGQEALLQAGAVQHEGIIQEVLGCLPDDQATTRPDQKQLLFDVIEAVGEEGYYHMEDWEGGMLKADASWLARLRVDNTSSRKYVRDRTEELAQAWVAPSFDNAENDQLDNEGVQWTPYNDDSEDIKDAGVEDSAAESQPVDGAEIVAYFGGMAFKKSDEEWVARLYPGMKLRWYGSGADAGRQRLKTLIQSVKAGRVYHEEAMDLPRKEALGIMLPEYTRKFKFLGRPLAILFLSIGRFQIELKKAAKRLGLWTGLVPE